MAWSIKLYQLTLQYYQGALEVCWVNGHPEAWHSVAHKQSLHVNPHTLHASKRLRDLWSNSLDLTLQQSDCRIVMGVRLMNSLRSSSKPIKIEQVNGFPSLTSALQRFAASAIKTLSFSLLNLFFFLPVFKLAVSLLNLSHVFIINKRHTA